jgi:hypothetical protein
MLMLNLSFWKRWKVKNNILKVSVVTNSFYVQDPCNFSVENNIESLYMIGKWDVPSFQCRMSLNWPTAMSEIHGLLGVFRQVW